MRFKQYLNEASVGKLYHTTSRVNAESIMTNGFSTGIGKGLSLGPGVYLSVDHIVFPSHLNSIGDISPVVTLEVAVDRSVKLLRVIVGSNIIFSIIKALFDRNEATRFYDKHNREFWIMPSGKPNWKYLHNLIIKKGYGGIEVSQLDSVNDEVIVFDATKVHPIRII